MHEEHKISISSLYKTDFYREYELDEEKIRDEEYLIVSLNSISFF